MNSGRRWAGDCKGYKTKIIFIFKTRQKMIKKRKKKVGTFYKVGWQFYIFSKTTKKVQNRREEKGYFSFLNCLNFVAIFVKFWKWKYFFLIFLANPRPSRSGIQWPINFSKKKLIFCIFSKKKKGTSLYRDIHPGDSWPYVH